MKTKDGSSLLIIFMMTTFLSMLSFGYWYKTSLLVDLVNQREIYYKNFYLTEKILNYGVNFAKNNFTQLTVDGTKVIFPVILDAQFLLTDLKNPDLTNPDLSAEIIINKVSEKQKLYLKAILLSKSNKNILCKLSCKLAMTEVFNEKSKEKQIYFVVQNFTIGNFI